MTSLHRNERAARFADHRLLEDRPLPPRPGRRGTEPRVARPGPRLVGGRRGHGDRPRAELERPRHVAAGEVGEAQHPASEAHQARVVVLLRDRERPLAAVDASANRPIEEYAQRREAQGPDEPAEVEAALAGGRGQERFAALDLLELAGDQTGRSR